MVNSSFLAAEEEYSRSPDSTPRVGVDYRLDATIEPQWSDVDEQRLISSLTHLVFPDLKGTMTRRHVVIADSRISALSIRRLIGYSNDRAQSSTCCLDQDVINGVTSLIAIRSRRTDITFLNSQVPAWFQTMISTRGSSHCDPAHRADEINLFCTKLATNTRNGATVPVRNARFVFAPCQVNGNHWIFVVVDRVKRTVHCADSFPSGHTTEVSQFCQTVVRLVQTVEGTITELEESDPINDNGSVLGYPQQENVFDCGVFVCLAADAVATGVRPAVNRECIVIWRKVIALALLEFAS